MGTYGREIREKRACLGNNGGTRGAHWTHKIVTICVTFCVRGGSHACAKRAPGASCVMCEMCTSWGRETCHCEPSGHHAGPHGASGEPSSRTDKAVPGQVSRNEEICAIDMM